MLQPIPLGMMLLSSGMFCYSRFVCFHSSGSCLMFFYTGPQGSIGFSYVFLSTATRDRIYHTSSAHKRVNIFCSGELPSKCGDCGESCPDVIPPAHSSRSPLNSDMYMYFTQITYLGLSSSCHFFLGLVADLIMCSGYSLALRTSVTCFFPFLTFPPITTVFTQLNRHDEATPLLTC